MPSQFLLAVLGAALIAVPGNGNAAQPGSRYDTVWEIATEVGRVLGAASVCPAVSPPRIKAMADKVSGLISAYAVNNEEASSIRHAYDQSKVVGQRNVTNKQTDCAAAERNLSQLERTVTSPPQTPVSTLSAQTSVPTSPSQTSTTTSSPQTSIRADASPPPARVATITPPTSAAPITDPSRSSIDTLRFAGSNTVGAELVPELVRLYARTSGANDIREEKPGEDNWSLRAAGKSAEFKAEVASHGSATAVSALLARNVDIGMMSRP
ncbi:MAG: hypothetical protein WCE35_26620, partial [Bradyrhizobium sp.]